MTHFADPDRRSHCLTGATGFVGAALALEILKQTSDPVSCIVRGNASGESPSQRLLSALTDTVRGSGDLYDSTRIDRGCSAVEGDLVSPRCGVDPDRLGGISDFWHCAASLKFSNEDRDEIFEHNVEGTRHAIELARAIGCKHFHYISTAYVAGSSEGLIAEGPAKSKSALNNCYEESKFEAERVVAESGLPFRIIRPSIVIGYSSTRWSSSDSGFYGYIKKVAQLYQLLESQGKASLLPEITVPGDPNARLNLVPVDLVARIAVQTGLSESAERYFHICSGASPTLGEMQSHIMPQVGFGGPWISRRPAGGAHPEYGQLIEEGMTFYKSYLTGVKEFSRENTLAAIGVDEAPEPVTLDELSEYALRFLKDSQLLPSHQQVAPSPRLDTTPRATWPSPG